MSRPTRPSSTCWRRAASRSPTVRLQSGGEGERRLTEEPDRAQGPAELSLDSPKPGSVLVRVLILETALMDVGMGVGRVVVAVLVLVLDVLVLVLDVGVLVRVLAVLVVMAVGLIVLVLGHGARPPSGLEVSTVAVEHSVLRLLPPASLLR